MFFAASWLTVVVSGNSPQYRAAPAAIFSKMADHRRPPAAQLLTAVRRLPALADGYVNDAKVRNADTTIASNSIAAPRAPNPGAGGRPVSGARGGLIASRASRASRASPARPRRLRGRRSASRSARRPASTTGTVRHQTPLGGLPFLRVGIPFAKARVPFLGAASLPWPPQLAGPGIPLLQPRVLAGELGDFPKHLAFR